MPYAAFYLSIGKIFIVILNVLILWFIIMLSLKRSDFIELIVPIVCTIIFSNLICNSILGVYDEIVDAILTCVAVDLEQHNGKVKFGNQDLHKILHKIYACHDSEK